MFIIAEVVPISHKDRILLFFKIINILINIYFSAILKLIKIHKLKSNLEKICKS